MTEEVLNSYALLLALLRRMVADLDSDQMVAQPGGVVNHPAWTIGHLVYSSEAIGEEFGLSPWLPDGWDQQFGTGSTPVTDVTAYPDKAALLKALDDGQARLAAALTDLGQAGLSQPLPDVRYRDQLPTIGHAAIHILAGHTAMHVGQVAAWRKAMGLPAVVEQTVAGIADGGRPDR